MILKKESSAQTTGIGKLLVVVGRTVSMQFQCSKRVAVRAGIKVG